MLSKKTWIEYNLLKKRIKVSSHDLWCAKYLFGVKHSTTIAKVLQKQQIFFGRELTKMSHKFLVRNMLPLS